MSWFIILILCFVAPAINSFVNGWRLAVVKKEDEYYESVNDVLSETHPIFNLISVLLMTICPLAILIIVIMNVVAII